MSIIWLHFISPFLLLLNNFLKHDVIRKRSICIGYYVWFRLKRALCAIEVAIGFQYYGGIIIQFPSIFSSIQNYDSF